MAAVRGQCELDMGQILQVAVWSFKKMDLFSFSIYKRNTSWIPGFNQKANEDMVRNFKQTSERTELYLEKALAAVWYYRAGGGWGY